MQLREEIAVSAGAETVFNFFENMAAHYTDWHPDHLEYQWIKGHDCRVGNEFRFVETIGGIRKAQTMRFIEIIPGAMLAFAPVNPFIRLLMPRLSFHMTPHSSKSCTFTAKIQLRVGPIAARLNKREFDAVKQHMYEEGINLKRMVEQKEAVAWAA